MIMQLWQKVVSPHTWTCGGFATTVQSNLWCMCHPGAAGRRMAWTG